MVINDGSMYLTGTSSIVEPKDEKSTNASNRGRKISSTGFLGKFEYF